MFDDIVENLVCIKQEFASSYKGDAHIQEVVPASPSNAFPIPENDLRMLHAFAQKNPIYTNSYQDKILGIDCIVYEGDINQYWLNSIKHGSSCQPFYPTWIMSAYLMALAASDLGCKELVDVGSGDGRIAFCGSILGMTAHSIEIDDVLVSLQRDISRHFECELHPLCSNALEMDYSALGLTHPAFFIGGLAQMGGDVLATGIIKKIRSLHDLSKNTCMVFTGTHSKRKLSNNLEDGGWRPIISEHNLHVVNAVSLPTVWTFDQKTETPYIYAKFRQSQKNDFHYQ